MKKREILGSLLIISFCLAISFFLLIQQYQNSTVKAKDLPVRNHILRLDAPVMAKDYSSSVTVGAVGDILIHDTVYKDAFINGKYDFNPIFQSVKSMLEKPDLVTANQESILGGTEMGLSNYPIFNSPQEVANALINAGVDIVSTANNHSLDKGEKGIDSEINYFNLIGLPHVGSYESVSDQQKIIVIQKNGIRLAFLSYTYGTNGIPLPAGKDFLVNLINRDKMKEEIQRAKKEADMVVMSIHWGVEYSRLPNEDQRTLAQYLADEGVDILFGSHPHVLQPMEWIKAKDGRKVFVVYSLGNFISGQSKEYKDIGGMATIKITKKIQMGKTSIDLTDPLFYPTYVSSRNSRNYRVVPLENADQYGLFNAKKITQDIQHHMMQWIH